MAVITPKILHVRSSNLCPNWDLEIFPTRKSAKMLFLSLISFRGHFEKRSHITLWDHIRFPWQNFDSVRTSTPAKVVCEKRNEKRDQNLNGLRSVNSVRGAPVTIHRPWFVNECELTGMNVN